MRCRDVPVRFEIEHCSGITGEPEPTEHLSKNVEVNLNVGDSHDDAAGDTENDGEEDTVQHNSGGGVGGVSGDTGGTETDGETQNEEVDPFRNLSVRPHQTGVDVLGVGGDWFAAD